MLPALDRLPARVIRIVDRHRRHRSSRTHSYGLAPLFPGRSLLPCFLLADLDHRLLQAQLDTFRQIYNEQRPHRALDRRTPAQAYTAQPKARPTGTPTAGYYRVRFDHVGTNGKISLRRAGKMHHLGIGTAHAGKAVVILVTDTHVTVIDRATRQTLATNTGLAAMCPLTGS